ncbi:hypothetical protein S140_208 [Shewanella sp. phage 1/40]|uniref:hypothetical protein n=1 Tax=Shewanella sp. phage 1/40 TaxID=1458860 RepID=UPI0004F67F26|nr:hypothetical protein S140_208 [Shewanella sp. phage 1/40]AHK11615.1 hypothetical protein S140_208 [Shewanella sp. phage 1/40]
MRAEGFTFKGLNNYGIDITWEFIDIDIDIGVDIGVDIGIYIDKGGFYENF